MTSELQRVESEITEAERLLRDGHPDVSGLTMALRDWHIEKRLVTNEAYGTFLARKRQRAKPAGFKVSALNPKMHGFQKFQTAQSLERGKSAIWDDCGMGKTLMELEWAAHVCDRTGRPVLILAPLAVSLQTRNEGLKFDYDVKVCRDQADVQLGINITNYEILHKFDASTFAGIVLDESSILKSYTGATRNQIIESFVQTPYRLACTATPSPNDYMEIGNHAEFLGVMSRTAMLATFFNHDGGETSKWRLKGHAVKPFWEWVASWASIGRKPSDIDPSFSDAGYNLLPIRRHIHIVQTEAQEGMLFAVADESLSDRRESRRISVEKRVDLLAEMANGDKEQWLIWGDLNVETQMAAREILGCVEVAGGDTPEFKERTMLDFAQGKVRRLATKRTIGGFGMNWQNCSRMASLGMSDSWEQIYQGERRCWRYGQTKPVDSHFIVTDRDENVLKNIERKQRQADGMAAEMVEAMRRANE